MVSPNTLCVSGLFCPWNDVLGVLGTMRDGLDVRYLAMWAERLKVSDLLERALEESKT